MIQTKNQICFTPQGEALFQAISVHIEAGQWWVVRGPNGSGKSTWLRTLADLDSHYLGEVLRSEEAQSLAYMPQLTHLHFSAPITLGEILSLAGDLNSEAMQLAYDLDLVDKKMLSRPWNGASGGERQKTLLVRAVLQKTKILILDEPFNHLDRKALQAAQTFLEQNIKSSRSAIIMSCHNEWEVPDSITGEVRIVPLIERKDCDHA